VLDIVVLKNVRLSKVIVADILDSHRLPIVLHLLDYIRTTNLSDAVDKFTDWERSQCLASELILPISKLTPRKKPIKRYDTLLPIRIASAYRLSISKITFSGLNKDLPGLETAIT
jgi:hypothetical protein